MNCNVPTDIVFSFTGFAQRGGHTDTHHDGWGIAFFEGAGVRHFVDHQSAVASPVADLIKRFPIKSKNVIAHIRKATQGQVALENCHPFVRELWGRYWVFAHNGDLKQFAPVLDGAFRPVGNTDSELAFCYLLQQLRRRFGDTAPALPALRGALEELVAEIAAHGVFNLMLSSGDALFAHCSTKLCYVVRQHPFNHRPAVRRGRQRRFRRGHHAKRPGGGDRHRAADDQRTMDPVRARRTESLYRRSAHRLISCHLASFYRSFQWQKFTSAT